MKSRNRVAVRPLTSAASVTLGALLSQAVQDLVTSQAPEAIPFG